MVLHVRAHLLCKDYDERTEQFLSILFEQKGIAGTKQSTPGAETKSKTDTQRSNQTQSCFVEMRASSHCLNPPFSDPKQLTGGAEGLDNKGALAWGSGGVGPFPRVRVGVGRGLGILSVLLRPRFGCKVRNVNRY